MKPYNRFQTEEGKFVYRVYGNGYGLAIEVTIDKKPFILQNLIVQNLPIADKSQLTDEQWLETAKKLSHLISR